MSLRNRWVVWSACLLMLPQAFGCGKAITARDARAKHKPQKARAIPSTPRAAPQLVRLAARAAAFGEPRRQIVESALAMTGAPARNGLDCSSLAKRLYGFAGEDLPRTVRQQLEVGVPVTVANLVPGDLVFFAFKSSRADHVGIYTGEGTFVHVSSSARAVRLDSLHKPAFARVHVGNRRVLEATP